MKIGRILVVGIGSPHGDDQLGWMVADAVGGMISSADITIRLASSPVDLLAWIDGVQRLILCDCCHGLGLVGDSHRWLWPSHEFCGVTLSGTHNLSLPMVLKLAEKLGRLPGHVAIWGIEGAAHEAGTPLSPHILESVNDVASRIADELIADVRL